MTRHSSDMAVLKDPSTDLPNDHPLSSAQKVYSPAYAFLTVLVSCIAIFALPALLWTHPFLLLIGYAVLAFGMFLLWHDRLDIIVYVLGAALGTSADMLLVTLGAWHFTGTTLVPVWLPLAWGALVLVTKRGIGALQQSSMQVSRNIISNATGTDRQEPGLLRFRTTRVLVVGVVSAAVFLQLFVCAQLLSRAADVDTWLLRLIKQRYAALIQVPALAALTFCAVCLLEVVSGERIEFEAFSVKFRGAAGPIVLWIFSFLAVAFATYMLWSLPGLP